MPARFYVILVALFALSIPIVCAGTAYSDSKQQHSISKKEAALDNVQTERTDPVEPIQSNELQQQRIQSLQSALIEQDIKNQREIAKLQDTLDRQASILKTLEAGEKDSSNLSLILSALGTLLAGVTLAVGLFGIFGYFGLKDAATKKAGETADKVVKDEITKGTFDRPISEAGQRTLSLMLSTGAFNTAIEDAVQRVAFNQSDTEDELDQEENEDREGG